MSSMMKKKTGKGFKPTARPRVPGASQPARPFADTPPAPATSQTPAPTTEQDASQSAMPSTTREPLLQPGQSENAPLSTSPKTGDSTADPTPTGTTPISVDNSSSLASIKSSQATTTAVKVSSSTPSAATRQSGSAGATAADASQPIPTIEIAPPEGDDQSSTEPTSATGSAKKQTPAKRVAGKRAAVSTEDENGEAAESETSPDGEAAGPKRRRPTRKMGATQDGEAAARQPRKRKQPSAEGAEGDATGAETPAPRKRRERSATPDDADQQTVDPSVLTLKDLTVDLRIGKKFKRYDEILQREREKQAKIAAARRQRALSKSGRGVSVDPSEPSGTPLPGIDKEDSTPAPVPVPVAPAQSQLDSLGPQFIEVDGQIVLDQRSLQVDAHARAEQRDLAEGITREEQEEHDFSHHVTSNSFLPKTSKIRGPNIWNEEDTELLYRGLRMFGTDFQMISAMFPGRTRRHVKMKFNREERLNPTRIHAVLVGEKTVKIDLQEYKQWTKRKEEFVPTETIMAEQRRAKAEFDAAQKAKEDEKKAAMEEKRRKLWADGEEEGAADLAAEEEEIRKKKKGKKKRKKDDLAMYGEIVEESLA
ncbi:Transcription factor TFIIIB component B [Verticillium nonalfalfae]|uniref:Transcription factor TFIIIB component B n=1 Tax=Verticillium nonalfalfae TaxID=1051616 RepID=A0A3M9YCH5_9PEZI|nr:Transcription factor TFIIIB component B [Verticillium nonalfalfae]RNJ57845.1 Transcription factor TFIIIB component B [Verticillium nonalfalfae]